jgi:Transposase IS66 family
LDDILAGFKGVLVSDFYGGYDGLPCRQQKCLIHLMRDINDAILKHPFNEELAFVARRFGALLREIVETIDRYGLKKRHLGKHKRSAERFLDDVAALPCATEVSSALKKESTKTGINYSHFSITTMFLGTIIMPNTRFGRSRAYVT